MYIIQSHDGAGAVFAQYGGIWGTRRNLDTMQFEDLSQARWYLDNRMLSNADIQRRAFIAIID